MGDAHGEMGMGELAAEVARLRADVDGLRADVAGPAAPTRTPPSPSPADHRVDRPIDRRSVLRRSALLAAGAAAGAAGLAATSAPPVAAANDSPLVLGQQNGATASTGLTVTGTGRPYGIAVTDNGLGSYSRRAAILGHAKAQAFEYGVHGEGSGARAGVLGTATSSYGVWGEATSGVGGVFKSGTGTAINAFSTNTGVTASAPTALVLAPYSSSAPPATATVGSIRSQAVGSQARIWAFTGGSLPWKVIAGPGSAGSLHPLPTAERLYDSRPGTAPSLGPKTPLAANVVRELGFTSPTIPTTAQALLVNVLLVNAASGNGNFTIWRYGAAKPLANTLVWGGSAGRFATMALVSLAGGAGLWAQLHASLRTDVVLDCVGYYQ